VRRAVLFDFGGVILTSPFEAFADYEDRLGLPTGFLRSVNATNPDANAWARLERGELSVPDFSDAFAEESESLGYRVPGSDVLALLGGELRPQMVAALRRITTDGRFVTAMLTNNFLGPGDAGGPAAWEPVLDMFDAVIESSRLGVRKPDRRFYELACEELGIDPHEAVFLDDLGVNLKPAREMGMATIKVVDPDVALVELAAIIGLELDGSTDRPTVG
jgi:putative hydrolase of the HAD superfamily